MPRVKTASVPFAGVSRLLRGYANAVEIADKLGKSYGTAKSRLDNPENLTLGELRRLSMRLHIPKEELMEEIKW